ncbi:DUF2948 family protein [Sinorhizobium garamanticum]|uniref:DUF2948 family protein n=1 Tax=Sinorhizobium garamanticum TaxID=680247 RepID=A0ABY8DDN5_9HYPH|nr:DUF2948 family protein [Sinorhizobium garamanticum]WEX88163.1 DUF2948 family protein [Sinorhizobium garamanticum]
MDALKLLALDEEDLGVVSAHVQDAVFKVAGISYDPRRGQLFLVINRFVWENADGKRRSFERRRAVLSFKRVVAVRSLGFDRGDAEAVLDLLALRFSIKGEGPEGAIELVLAGEASIMLDVECIEVQLADTGGAWETAFRPRHPEGA